MCVKSRTEKKYKGTMLKRVARYAQKWEMRERDEGREFV